MISESTEEEPVEEQRQEQAPTQQEQSQREHKTNDDTETGCWGSYSRREVICIVATLVLMIAVTFTGVFVAVNNANASSQELDAGNTASDLFSEYKLPVKPAPIVITDQQELDMIIKEISSNAVLSEKASKIPNTITALLAANTDDADSYIKAASWITSVDTMNVQQDVMARFVLASIYYRNAGTSWKNSTNWLSPTMYHCDWYGVNCCEEVIGSVVCRRDSFGQVLELDFYKNNLAGPIPTSVVLLPFLHALYLNENSLTGSIPAKELASMTNFGKFYAQYNYLNGTVSDEIMASTSIGKCHLPVDA